MLQLLPQGQAETAEVCQRPANFPGRGLHIGCVAEQGKGVQLLTDFRQDRRMRENRALQPVPGNLFLESAGFHVVMPCSIYEAMGEEHEVHETAFQMNL